MSEIDRDAICLPPIESCSSEELFLVEESVIIPRKKLTSVTRKKMDNSVEKLCRKTFDIDEISVPTSFMVLPYDLKQKKSGKHASADRDTDLCVTPEFFDLAEQIGKCLLDINTATAKLSFWLLVQRKFGDGQEFKLKVREWLHRAKKEKGLVVAKEIIDDIDCGPEYLGICRQFLEKTNDKSKAREYITNPIEAAAEDVQCATDSLLRCYLTDSNYFYLVDELQATLVSSAVDYFGISYPMRLVPNAHIIQGILLPFMNICVMSLTSVGGLEALARLVGFPPKTPIPSSWWKEGRIGLIHKPEQPSSIVALGCLQRTLRERGNVGYGNARRPSQPLAEVQGLEKFFKERDHASRFSDLQRVTDEYDSVLWTTEDGVDRLKGEAEVVRAERRLRHLKKARSENDDKNLDDQIEELRAKVKDLRVKGDSLKSSITSLASNTTMATEPSDDSFFACDEKSAMESTAGGFSVGRGKIRIPGVKKIKKHFGAA